MQVMCAYGLCTHIELQSKYRNIRTRLNFWVCINIRSLRSNCPINQLDTSAAIPSPKCRAFQTIERTTNMDMHIKCSPVQRRCKTDR